MSKGKATTARRRKTRAASDVLDAVINELQQFTRRYKSLIREIERQHKNCDGARIMATADYQEFMELWKDLYPTGHDQRSALRLKFETVIAPAWDLISRTEEAVRVKCALSGDRALLETFISLPFVRNFDECVKGAPFRTIAGLEAILALFKSNRGLAAASGTAQTPSTSGSPDIEKLAVAKTRKEPHPDPESVLQAYPGGLTKRKAAEVLGIGLRRVEQLIQDGDLIARGRGNTRRITCESISARNNVEKK
jgi:hypothetical protein